MCRPGQQWVHTEPRNVFQHCCPGSQETKKLRLKFQKGCLIVGGKDVPDHLRILGSCYVSRRQTALVTENNARAASWRGRQVRTDEILQKEMMMEKEWVGPCLGIFLCPGKSFSFEVI